MDPHAFRDVIGRFASGVTVITARHEGRPYGTTASAISSLSLDPPMVLICLNRNSSTGQAIDARRRFAINILGEDQADAAMRFGRKDPDKFRGVAVVGGADGAPLLEDALATLECRVVENVDGGTHHVFLAQVERASGRPGSPLAYFRGQFGRLELAQDEAALRDIRARVMSRELPVGEPLAVDEVAAMVGVPSGSAYHALTKLTGEGLLTRAPDGWFVIAPLTVAAVDEGLRARRAIELGVAAATVGRLSIEELRRFRAAVERTRPTEPPDPFTPFDIDGYLATYGGFHAYFVGLADSPALVDAHRRVNAPAMIVRMTAPGARTPNAFRDAAQAAYRHHVELIEAYEAADPIAAAATIRRHIDDALAFTRRYMAAGVV
jgi:flavin reductase (DIM6/NTAB) family NADH-FMN oxidoreductase RutF/DNA-binding GntR family transcriptional regulator